MSELPEKVIAFAQAIHEAGGRALLVGGCVRDMLMGNAAERLGPRSLQAGAANVCAKFWTSLVQSTLSAKRLPFTSWAMTGRFDSAPRT